MTVPFRPLTDIVEINPSVKLDKGKSYPFVPMEELTPGQRYVQARAMREAGGGAKFCHGDTLFARITPCLENGKIAQFIAKPGQCAFGSTEYWVLRAREGLAEPGYVYYLALSGVLRGPAEKSMAGASGRQRADLASIQNLAVPAPDLATQRRIASILSAYDDLIENNTRRIAILEEMARRIYEEWFAHFHFPGHEGGRMVESELGPVPEGWGLSNLGELTEYINRGLTPKYDDEAAGLVINQKCIRDGRLNMEPARTQSKPIPPEKLIRFGDVLINSTGVGTLGRVAQVYETLDDCTVDTHVSIVRPIRELDQDYFGLALLRLSPHFERQGVGATGQTELSRGRIAETLVVVPPQKLQQDFGAMVRPIRKLAVVLGKKNANLRTQRDLLLPKLISGEIDVSALPEPEAIAA